MPLFNFTHLQADGTRRNREFAYDIVPDWADHWGSLTLVVLLHGGGQTALELASSAQFTKVMSGDWDPDGEPQKLVVIYPQGLGGNRNPDEGNWNNGHMNPRAYEMDVDDSDFIITCITVLQSHLRSRAPDMWFTDPADPEPQGDMYDKALICGFSNGGQMAYRVVAENPGVFDAIGVVGCTSGGYRLAGQSINMAYLVHWGPDAGDQISLIHIHSRSDGEAPILGGPVGFSATALLMIGTDDPSSPNAPLVEPYLKYYLAIDENSFDNIDSEHPWALEPWIEMVDAVGLLWEAEATVTTPEPFLTETTWAPTAPLLIPGAGPVVLDKPVVTLVVDERTELPDAHSWPNPAGSGQVGEVFGWSATERIWRFFKEHT